MEQATAKSDKWIPRMIVLFFVGLAVVDGIFVAIAVSTHSGVVTERAYEKGLDYNATVAAAAAQAERGWQGEIAFTSPRLTFTLYDRQGEGLEGAEVIAHFSRPVQAGHDFSAPLAGQGGGIYGSAIGFALPGQWDVTIAVRWNGQHYQQTKRIIAE